VRAFTPLSSSMYARHYANDTQLMLASAVSLR
jgi:hypothetical protein